MVLFWAYFHLFENIFVKRAVVIVGLTVSVVLCANKAWYLHYYLSALSILLARGTVLDAAKSMGYAWNKLISE